MPTDKRYNNYTISILVTTLVGVGVIIPALIMHALSLGSLSTWLIDFVSVVFGIAFVSRLVSGSSYIAQLVDRLMQEYTILDVVFTHLNLKKTDLKNGLQDKQQLVNKNTQTVKEKRKNKYFGQFVGNSLGFIIATTLGIVTLCLHAVTPTIINGFISSAFFLINHISNFSGLFNRSGRAIDFFRKDISKKDNVTKEKKGIFRRHRVNYVLGVLLGAVAAAILITVILTVVGVTSAMSLGGAVPIWLSLGLLVVGTVSTGASAGGYIGRCFDFILGKRTLVHAAVDITQKEKPANTIKSRISNEHIGTVIGVGLGVTLATILIVAGVASLPFFGLGLPKLFAGIILMTACVSQCGGLGNRLGQMLDKYFKKGKYQQKTENGIENIATQTQNDHPSASPGDPNNRIVVNPSPQPIKSKQNYINDYAVLSQATLTEIENKQIDIQNDEAASVTLAKPKAEIINPKFKEKIINQFENQNISAIQCQMNEPSDKSLHFSINDLTHFSIFNKYDDRKRVMSQNTPSEFVATETTRCLAAAAA